MTIVGFDVSSKRIDMSWLDQDKPCRWHQILPTGHLIDRLRAIDIEWWRVDGDIHCSGSSITDIAIEMPFGQSRSSVAALMSVVAIITRQAPPWARVAWPSSGELRQAINAKNTKESAHLAIRLYTQTALDHIVGDWDEHELDALVACIGWQKILEANE